MNTWTRVTPYGLKQMPAPSTNAGAYVSASTQAKLDTLYKDQRDIWIGNQHIITNTDGSIKSITIDASHQMLNPLNQNTQLINTAETLKNSSPYNSIIQQQLDKAGLQSNKNSVPQNTLVNNPAINPVPLPPQINNKLDSLLNASRSQSANSETLQAFINTPQQNFVEDTAFLNTSNQSLISKTQAPIALNDLDVSESQSIALQRAGLGLNLSEKATNDIAQLKAGLIAQTLKQTENIVTQVNARYNPFAAAQQVASQQTWRQAPEALAIEYKVVADTELMPQSGAADKQGTNGGRSMSYNSSSQSGLMQRRKQTSDS